MTEARERPLRIGHKGADAIAAGNTLESFRAAVEIGVDVIEFDVLRPRSDFADPREWRNAQAGPVSGPTDPLVVAHDWGDAARREPLTLGQTLDAFATPPLERVQIDVDLKIAGREDELVDAIDERGLRNRAMVSTMELSSLRELGRIDPGLRIGWTVPKTYRDWTGHRWAKPLLAAGLASLRTRLPSTVRKVAPALGVWAVWAYHGAITPRLIEAAHSVDVQVVAWTVDDATRVDALTAMGIDGICTNDPRLLLTPNVPRHPA